MTAFHLNPRNRIASMQFKLMITLDNPQTKPLDQLCINTIRTLAMDGVQKANSGHPGAPMGLAPVAYWIWEKFLNHNPDNPHWPNRDRFVLSGGHGSMLLYSLLHLTGYDLPLNELQSFRQWNSKTPGHPESGLTPGVETTTGPLGQGFTNSVGMAIAERWLNARFGNDVVDYRIYAMGGDGDMMEGVCCEAASIAGHLGLHKLLWIYDNNKITIEGKTSLAFTEDVALRFKAYGWYVQHVKDANDLRALNSAIKKAQKQTDKPSLIVVDSHIGYGAPTKQDTHSAHGEPLGDDEIAKTKAKYGWPADAKFLVPEDVSKHMGKAWRRGRKLEKTWQENLAKLTPELAAEWQQIHTGTLPANWDKDLPVFPADPKGIATRESGGKVINAVAKTVPWLLGGAADLAPSTKTNLTGLGDFQKGSYSGRNFHFGVREHAMTGIINGMALSKLRPFGSGFLIFSDYARGSLRLGAVMELPVIHVFTHDSVGVGEDGPTHQPIEQLASLRAIPHMIVLRPGDANEVTEAWRVAMTEKKHPVALALTRQAVPTLDRAKYAPASGLRQGGYILSDSTGQPALILIGTGSELSLIVEAGEKLRAEGINVRIVSMPSCELFDRQPVEYRQRVLPANCRKRVAVEAGVTQSWYKYVGLDGAIIGIDRFGASAPFKEVFKNLGLTTDNVYATAKAVLAKS